MSGLIIKNKIILLMAGILFPAILFSQGVEITEILYDAPSPGEDKGREWVEILIKEGDNFDLTTWKFFENNQKHAINFISGNQILSSGDCLVLVDDVDKFRLDWPNFTGNLFDSAFSLKNTDGEELKVLSPLGGSEYKVEDSIFYQPIVNPINEEWFSLSKINNNFIKSTPTPGSCQNSGANEMGDNDSDNNNDNDDDDTVTEDDLNSNSSNSAFQIVVPEIFLKVDGRFETISAGSSVYFSAKVYGSQSKIIENPRVVWSFGDGYRAEGKNISHVWNYPGEYFLVVNASSNESVDTFYQKIVVKEAKVSLDFLGLDNNFQSRLVIKNRSDFDLDISGWFLKKGEEFFIFPEETIIFKQGEITVDNKLTDFEIEEFKVNLFYPNGVLVRLNIEKEPILNYPISNTKIETPKKETQNPPSVSIDKAVENLDLETNVKDLKEGSSLGDELSAGPIKSSVTWPYLLGVFGLVGAGILVVYRSKVLEDGENNNEDKEDIEKEKIKEEAKSFEIVYDEDDE